MEEIGIIISSERLDLNDATAVNRVILLIVIDYPKGRYAPSDIVMIRSKDE